jgi:[acyl-carrier-protein] S-malonyltransferase
LKEEVSQEALPEKQGCCFLYPGQGSQYPGMGRDLWEASPKIRELFELASEITRRDMKALIFDSSEEVLKRTDNTQPALTLINTAFKEYLKSRGLVSAGCAGFSLGEYSALEDAGVISPEDLFKLTALRGRLMQAAGDRFASGGAPPGMAAVIGLPMEKVEALLSSSEGGLAEVFPANYNAPAQIVLAGTAKGLGAAEEKLRAAGARRFIPLKVSAPFHCPLMAEAGAAFEAELEGYVFHDPCKNLYSNVSGGLVQTGAQAKALAAAQVTSPVRWTQEEETLGPEYRTLVECGPGQVLAGLWKNSGLAGSRGPEVCLPCGRLEEAESLLARQEKGI